MLWKIILTTLSFKMEVIKNKIKKMIDFLSDKKELNYFPDPYKRKESDFELTVQLFEDSGF